MWERCLRTHGVPGQSALLSALPAPCSVPLGLAALADICEGVGNCMPFSFQRSVREICCPTKVGYFD